MIGKIRWECKVRSWSMRSGRPSCGQEESVDGGSRNAQASKVTKPGATDLSLTSAERGNKLSWLCLEYFPCCVVITSRGSVRAYSTHGTATLNQSEGYTSRARSGNAHAIFDSTGGVGR